jgi:hypothetical protein
MRPDAPFAERFEALLALVMQPARGAFFHAKRLEYFAATGETSDEDRTLEARLQGFLEWLVFDVVLPEGETAPRLLARQSRSEEEAAGWRIAGRTVHGLFLVRGVRGVHGGDVAVENLLTGARYDVGEAPSTLKTGELFEGRLMPRGEGWRFTEAFLFHPTRLRRRLMRALRTGPLSELPPKEQLRALSRMAGRAEHFRNVALDALYDFERLPPVSDTPPMRFDPASVAERRSKSLERRGT